jgi:hypothetical protein
MRLRLLFDEKLGDLRHEEEWEAVLFPLRERIDPEDAVAVDYDSRDFRDQPPDSATYVLGGPPIDRVDFFKSAQQAIEEYLFRGRILALFKNTELEAYSRPGESEEEFQTRCVALAEDQADAEAEKLRDRYATKLKAAQQRLAQTERRLRELDVDAGQRRQQEMVAGAGEVLSMFLGGRRRVRSLSGMSSRRSQTVRAQERFRSATEKVDEQRGAIEDLEQELADEIAEIWDRWKGVAAEVEEFEVPLERTDIGLDEMTLFWAPSV